VIFAESRLCDMAGSGTRTDTQSLRIVPSRTWSSIRSPVGPYILYAPAAEDSVIHQGQPLDLRLPAGSLAHEEEDRADRIFDQLTFDLPYRLFALAESISADCRSISASTSELQPV
jgi:hypothetical protein